MALRRFSSVRSAQRFVRLYSSESTGPQSTGSQDSFVKREKASEDFYIKKHEKEQLKKLREEIFKREQELGDLKDKASKLTN